MDRACGMCRDIAMATWKRLRIAEFAHCIAGTRAGQGRIAGARTRWKNACIGSSGKVTPAWVLPGHLSDLHNPPGKRSNIPHDGTCQAESADMPMIQPVRRGEAAGRIMDGAVLRRRPQSSWIDG